MNKALKTCLTQNNTVRIIAGSLNRSGYIDSKKQLWLPERTFLTSTPNLPSWAFTNNGIANTNDPYIFNNETYGVDGNLFQYNIPISNGNYTLNLLFAEIYYSSINQRIFSVKAQGNFVLTNYDIFADVGANTATIKSFPIVVVNGLIYIEFINGAADWAKINGVEIIPR